MTAYDCYSDLEMTLENSRRLKLSNFIGFWVNNAKAVSRLNWFLKC